jgi:hypothetical protein
MYKMRCSDRIGERVMGFTPHLLHLGEDILVGREFAIQTKELLLLLSQLL